MAHALRTEQMTPADELRELLTASEKLIANRYRGGPGALTLLRNMDRLGQLWPELEAGGVDLRPEAGRWETLQAAVRRQERALVSDLRSGGGLAGLRAHHHPDGQAGWWWRLDESIAAQNKRRVLRGALIGAAALVVGVAAYLLLRVIFPVDPRMEAALSRQSAGEQKLQNNNDFAGALPDFQAAAELQPDDAAAWLRVGAIQQRLGDNAASDASFRRARALVSTDGEFYLYRAQVYLTFGLLDEGQGDIDTLLAADPENASAYYVRSSILEGLGQLGEAYAAVQKASELAEAQGNTQLTVLSRYRMAMMMQQLQSPMAPSAEPAATPGAQ